MGDSISTLDGYTEPEYAAFYEGMKKLETDVLFVGDTWWGQVIERLGGFVLVNNSFSGSTVVKLPAYEIPSYGCSSERTSALHRDAQMPDVIMIFMGTNDWGHGVKPRPSFRSEENDVSVFSVAYEAMLTKLRKNYPDAELWCLTLPVAVCTNRENFVFPYYYGKRHIEEYCKVICASAERFGCRVIDLYHAQTHPDTLEGFHPNADGMKTLADAVIALLETEGDI